MSHISRFLIVVRRLRPGAWGRAALVAGGCAGALYSLEPSVPSQGPRTENPPARKSSPSAPVASGARPVSLRLEENLRRNLRFSGEEPHIFEADLEARQFLQITFEQEELDIAVEVTLPDGDHFRVDGLSGKKGPELVPIYAEEGGRYQIKVSGEDPGRYWISKVFRRRANARDRSQAAAAIAYSEGRKLQEKKPAEADLQFAQAARLWDEGGSRRGEADALYRLGEVRWNSHRWRDSLEPLRKALTLYRGLGNRGLQMYTFNLLAVSYARLGELDKAEENFRKGLELALELGDRETEIAQQIGLGDIYLERGEFGGALRDVEAALWSAIDSGDTELQIQANNLLGRIYLWQGDARMALKFHGAAEEGLEKEPKRSLLASTLVHLADAYKDLDQWDRAIAYYQRAAALWRGEKDLASEATAYNNLAVTYIRMGAWDDARVTLGCVRALHQQSGNDKDAGIAAINLGWALVGSKRHDEALETFRAALQDIQRQGRRPAAAAAYFGMASAEKGRGDLDAALRHLGKALKILESLRTKAERRQLRRSFFAGRLNFYDLLVEIHMERHEREPAKGFDRLALEASEKARYRSLLDALDREGGVPSLSIRDLQERFLDRDTVLLEYFLGGERSVVWVVTSESVTSYALPPRAKIEPLVNDVQRLMGQSYAVEKRAEAIQKARELSDILIGPVARRLNRKRLVIVAPPELQYVSFVALPLPGAASREGSWPESWLSRFEVTVAPSATVVRSLRRRFGRPWIGKKLVAVVGNPVYERPGQSEEGPSKRSERFRNLRFSRDEMGAILANTKGAVTLLEGFDASRPRVLESLTGHSILHFSTHGEMVETSPGASAIVLSEFDREGNEIESHLWAEEIAEMDLPEELVVLSACSTGLGAEVRGEGLMGLSYAFFSAGAKRVVASLWDVDDEATAALMARFYGNLLRKRLSPAAALREAQLSISKEARWRDPYYWAGFVLQGDWQPADALSLDPVS